MYTLGCLDSMVSHRGDSPVVQGRKFRGTPASGPSPPSCSRPLCPFVRFEDFDGSRQAIVMYIGSGHKGRFAGLSVGRLSDKKKCGF